MPGEAPEFKRCCFCLPIRRGLIAWGYVKIALNILTPAYIILMLLHEDYSVLTVAFLLTDISIDIFFVTSYTHKENIKVLEVFYVYNIVWLGLLFWGNGFQINVVFSYVNMMWKYQEHRIKAILYGILSAGIAFSLIFVQTYLILQIRNDMAKLHKQSSEMQSLEPQCTHNASIADQCEGKTQVVQTSCTDKKQDLEDCYTDEEQAVQHYCTGDTQVMKYYCTGEKQVVQDCCMAKKHFLQDRCIGETQVVHISCTGETQGVQICCTGKTQAVQDCCKGEKQAKTSVRL